MKLTDLWSKVYHFAYTVFAASKTDYNLGCCIADYLEKCVAPHNVAIKQSVISSRVRSHDFLVLAFFTVSLLQEGSPGFSWVHFLTHFFHSSSFKNVRKLNKFYLIVKWTLLCQKISSSNRVACRLLAMF